MTTAIQQANLRGLEIESILWTDNSSEEIFEDFDAIVVRPGNVDPVRARIPEGVEIVEFVNELDDASRQYLDALLEHLRSE